ncbi:MAG: hypothetical protein HWN66_01515, partial [Candidatus Helarchaeota archaeon]|nr:hypothetical protein [Candidatus Helarchaeota archaeon]
MGKKKKIKRGISLIGGNAPSVPVAAQMHDHTMFLAQTPAKVFYYDAKKFVEDTADVVGYYQMDDMVPIGDAYNYEIEALGGKMIYGENSMP